jgi:hypothetical protein
MEQLREGDDIQTLVLVVMCECCHTVYRLRPGDYHRENYEIVWRCVACNVDNYLGHAQKFSEYVAGLLGRLESAEHELLERRTIAGSPRRFFSILTTDGPPDQRPIEGVQLSDGSCLLWCPNGALVGFDSLEGLLSAHPNFRLYWKQGEDGHMRWVKDPKETP